MRYTPALTRASASTLALLSAAAITNPLPAQPAHSGAMRPSTRVAVADTVPSTPERGRFARWAFDNLLPDAALVGGFAISDSRLGLAKFEKSHGKWSLISDLTRDATSEQWDAAADQIASRGQYVLWASSTSLRRYTRANGRGLYAEIGGGLGKAKLEVTPVGQRATTHRTNVPFATWGVGGRRGLGYGGLFVEGGFRTAIPLATRHAYAGASAPEGSTREPISYQSWYFGRGKGTSQMYLGLGVRR